MQRRLSAFLLVIALFTASIHLAAAETGLLDEYIGAHSAIPDAVSITNIQRKSKGVEIKGTAPDNRTIASFKDILKSGKKVQQVDLLLSARTKDGERSFRFRVKTKSAISSSSVSLQQFLGSEPQLPDGLVILSARKRRSKLLISGNAPSNIAIATLMTTLEKLDRTKNVDLNSSRTLKDGKRSFQLSIGFPDKTQKISGRKPVSQEQVGVPPDTAPRLEFSTEQKAELETLKQTVNDTGSRLTYALLTAKREHYVSEVFKEQAGKLKDYSETDLQEAKKKLRKQVSVPSYRLSRYSILSDVYGGFAPQNRRFPRSNSLSLLSGDQAIRETLQLDSVGRGAQSKGSASFAISSIEPLKVTSHPWEKMLEKTANEEPPEVFSLLPNDHFLLYFQHPTKFSDLSTTLKNLAATGGEHFLTQKILQIEEKVAKRLGIAELQRLQPLVEEFAFTSEDLSFYPGTQYALVLRLKEAAQKTLSLFFPADSPRQGFVGPFFVIASSEALFSRIKHTHANPAGSMQAAKDLRYMRHLLGKKRDGMVYLSEKFILKLVSPEHRINSARRNTALADLETLQYLVLAQRIFSGSWPKSFEKLVETNILPKKLSLDGFRIAKNGIVEHDQWGSLYKIAAVSEVPIETINKSEKTRYERFRRNYQNRWNRFFDPIIAGTNLDDGLYFHLVVLPLIDQSAYRTIGALSGGKPTTFSSLKKPLRISPLAVFAKLNFDELLLSEDNFLRLRRRSRGAEKSREEKMAEVNARVQKELKISEPIDLFNMLGNEFTIGLGTDAPLAIWNPSDLDVYLGIELEDSKRFEVLLNTISKTMFRKMAPDGGALPPQKKLAHREFEYRVAPFGFFNLYYLFHKDFAYLSTSRLAIHSLIDGTIEAPKVSKTYAKALAALGDKHNLLFLGEFASLTQMRNSLFSSGGMFRGRNRRGSHRNAIGYLTDVSLLGTALESNTEVKKYFRAIPDSVSGIPVELRNGQVFLHSKQAEGKAVLIDDVRTRRGSRRRSTGAKNSGGNKIVLIEELLPGTPNPSFLQALEQLETLSLSLGFPEDALEVKMLLEMKE